MKEIQGAIENGRIDCNSELGRLLNDTVYQDGLMFTESELHHLLSLVSENAWDERSYTDA